jgi:phage-related protein
MIPEIIKQLVTELVNNFPKIIEGGKGLVNSLVDGVKSLLKNITTAGGSIITTLVNSLKGLPSKMLEIGKNIVSGMIDGVKNMASRAVETVKNFGQSLINSAKAVLGIASPSKQFKALGVYTAEGFGEGFTKEMRDVTKDMERSIPTSLDVETKANTNGSSIANNLNYVTMVNAFKEALSEVDVELDDQKVGKFVKKTVTKAIYT